MTGAQNQLLDRRETIKNQFPNEHSGLEVTVSWPFTFPSLCQLPSYPTFGVPHPSHHFSPKRRSSCLSSQDSGRDVKCWNLGTEQSSFLKDGAGEFPCSRAGECQTTNACSPWKPPGFCVPHHPTALFPRSPAMGEVGREIHGLVLEGL